VQRPVFLQSRRFHARCCSSLRCLVLFGCGDCNSVIDVLAFASLFLVLRFIRHLSLIPGMGPMLLAIVKTWFDGTVILYLGAMLGFVLACAFAFEIAFGAEDQDFASMSRSFMSLFRMVRQLWRRQQYHRVALTATLRGAVQATVVACVSAGAGASSCRVVGAVLQGFTERPEVESMDEGIIARPASTIFTVFFILLSIILISLFIGGCLVGGMRCALEAHRRVSLSCRCGGRSVPQGASALSARVGAAHHAPHAGSFALHCWMSRQETC
jgi:hypothetical protein